MSVPPFLALFFVVVGRRIWCLSLLKGKIVKSIHFSIFSSNYMNHKKIKFLNRYYWKWFVFACSLCFTATSLAATTVPGGWVEGTWTKEGSPYLVEGRITVSSNKTLILEAGTIIRFATQSALHVYGNLKCDGTENEPVIMTSNLDTEWYTDSLPFSEAPYPGSWGGVYLAAAENEIYLHHLKIHYGGYSSSGALWLKEGLFTVQDCVITQSQGASMVVSTTADIQFNDLERSRDGIHVLGPVNGEIIIKNNRIAEQAQFPFLIENPFPFPHIGDNELVDNGLRSIGLTGVPFFLRTTFKSVCRRFTPSIYSLRFFYYGRTRTDNSIRNGF